MERKIELRGKQHGAPFETALIYIGVDPGTRFCGVAWETDDPRFARRAAYVVRSKALSLDLRAVDMATQIVNGLPVRRGERPLAIACVEFPRFYGTAKSKGDPNELIDLAGVAGVVLGALSSSLRVLTELTHPRTWKGSTPKEIHNARLARDFPQWVEPVERTSKSMQNHVWDACGLLEWIKSKTQKRK